MEYDQCPSQFFFLSFITLALRSTGLYKDLTAAADFAGGSRSVTSAGGSLHGGGIGPVVDNLNTGASVPSLSVVDQAAVVPVVTVGTEMSAKTPAVVTTAPTSSDVDVTAPGKEITVHHSRPRKDSIASLGSASITGSMTSYEAKDLDPPSAPAQKSLSSAAAEAAAAASAAAAGLDMQAIIQAAMTTVSGQLAEIAGTATTEDGASTHEAGGRERLESFSFFSAMTESSRQRKDSVDIVLASVAKADGNIDYASIANIKLPPLSAFRKSLTASSLSEKGPIVIGSFPNPTTAISRPLHYIGSSGRDMDAIRARARAAAGYVPPPQGTPASKPLPSTEAYGQFSTPEARPPMKKRAKRSFSTPQPNIDTPGTIKTSNVRPQSVMSLSYQSPMQGFPPMTSPPNEISGARKRPAPGMPPYSMLRQTVPHPAHSNHTVPRPQSGGGNTQANQKWEEMFVCLTKYIAEKKEQETADQEDKEGAEWNWEGNVPTTYKVCSGFG